MSFGINDTGIETYDEVTQLLFPHPPIIENRFMESGNDRVAHVTLAKTAVVTVFSPYQAKVWLDLFVRRLTETNMVTLGSLRDDGGLVRVKTTPGSAATVLCMFRPDEDQDWAEMIAPHPEAQDDGSAIPALLKVYEAHIALARME